MTLDEYKGLAAGLTADNAPTVFQSMLDGIGADLAALEKAGKDLETANKRIAELQDTNMKLFLTVTGKAPDGKEAEEDKTPEELRAALVEEIKGGNEK